MRRWFAHGWLVAALATAAGCRGANDEGPPRTGAEEAARGYFEALIRGDWDTAYAALDDRSRAACGRDEFARRAGAYAEALGFAPAEVVVQSCAERGDEAVAHVALWGGTNDAPKVARDAVGLRRGPAGWAVILPDHFDRPRGRRPTGPP